MASYNNAAYTYAQVLGGTGYFMQDDLLRYSAGVATMQTKLNSVGYNCGTPDGKFGSGTNTAVVNFQGAKGLTKDGKAGKNTLTALDAAVSGSTPSGTTYCSNSYLTTSQMTANAQYILNYLRGKGWTKNAVCGMLGNMQTESTINPGIWQSLKANNTSGGFGLVQWTPATKYIDWANSKKLPVANMDSELQRIIYEVSANIQYIATSTYKMTFSQFTKSTESAYYLACVFLHNYERPANSSQDKTRGDQATKWFNTLK
ncbi:phage tail tip lysozyme [Anaerosporobacter sp.]|uniref:phage tail tip lysozyme n=1 Tax=Anaerosporobacter sp. TaxID=1872529 RepID=UPI00286F4448|nr:phage tail tip lysozyme [Anaerosporobacter sp.]